MPLCRPLMCYKGTQFCSRDCGVLLGDFSDTVAEKLHGATPALGLVDLHSLGSFINNFNWDIFRLLKLLL